MSGSEDGATKASPERKEPACADAGSTSGDEGRHDEPGTSADAARAEVASAMDDVLGKMAGLGLEKKPGPPPPLLPSFDLAGIAKHIKAGKAKRIIVMCGAGISVSAGIPDFRTPGTGLYSQLEAYNLPTPEAIFSIQFFRANPEPFHKLARELYPGNYAPTPTHYFLTLLHKKGLLLRCFTQNIDSLEQLAGLPKEKIMAAHGNFDTASCIECDKPHNTDWVKDQIFKGETCICKRCGGLVKPDIVFFGEALPDRFETLTKEDFPKCDLLIVMGTSLQVYPFAALLSMPGNKVPRLLINRERVGERMGRGFVFDPEENYRDALYLGDCDSGVQKLADLLGWRVELDDLVRRGQEKFKRKPKAHPKAHTKATDKGQGKDEGKGKEEVKGSAGGSKDSQGDGKGKTEEGKPKGKGLIGALTSWL